MVKLGEELFSTKKNRVKEDNIMVLGSSMIFDDLFKNMVEKGIIFTVIVVDTSP
jgi:hypothetical protein